MRIVHFYPRLDLTLAGSLRAALDMAAASVAAGHEVTFLTFDDRDATQAWPPGVTPVTVSIDPPARLGRWFTRQQQRALENVCEGADVIHLHGVWEPTNPQVAAVAITLGVPYVVSLHGMLQAWTMGDGGLKKRAYLALAGTRLLRDAALIQVVAQEEAKQSRTHLPDGTEERIHVAPYPVDLRPYLELPGPDIARRALGLGDLPTVLFLSTLQHRKRPDIVVAAASLLRSRGRHAHHVIAGPGTAAEIARVQQTIDQHDAVDHVTLAGMVTGDLKSSLYDLADVFVLPTSAENFGIVFVESLATGTPVVTTKGTSIWRELEESEGCRIVAQTPEAFAEAVGELLADPDLRESTGRAGREWALRTFAPDAMASEYNAMYERAVQSP